MNQILHIFRKDTRHHWPEIVFSCIAAFVFAWREPLRWGSHGPTNGFVTAVPAIILVLIWWITTARVIQGESLVGDRQSWITRPYEWPKLLTAKLLFMAVFLSGPLFLADIWLLVRAGFFSVKYLPDILWMHLLLWLFFLLPPIALAAITETLVHFFLTVLGVALFIGGLAWFTIFDIFSAPSHVEDIPDVIEFFLFVAASIGVILWQYSGRRTTPSRMVVIATPVVIFAIVLASSSRLLIERIYPLSPSGSQAPLQVSISTAGQTPSPNWNFRKDKDKLDFEIPLKVSGLPPGALTELDGSRITLEGPNGLQWRSGWQSSTSLLHVDGQLIEVSFSLQRSLAEKLESTPVHAKVDLALNLYRFTEVQQKVTTDGEFAIPGNGVCLLSTVAGPSNTVKCIAPFTSPRLVQISVDSSSTTCPALDTDHPVPPDLTFWSSLWNPESGPPGPNLSPVETFDIYFWGWQQRDEQSPRICPGTPLTFHRFAFAGRTRIETTLGEVHLNDFRPAPIVFNINSD